MTGVIGLLLALSAAASAGAGGRPAAAPERTLPTKPAVGWLSNNEWDLAGNYVEACTDRPLCPSLFGSPSEGTVHTKVIALQITRGRWQKTDLGGLNVAIVVEAPSDRPMTTDTRAGWSACRLFVPENADSQQVAGLSRAVGLLLRGAGGPLFDSVERAPLVLGLSKDRVVLEVPDRVTVQLRPAASINGSSPPNLTNLGNAFRFLGPLYVYEADTLYCRPVAGAEPRSASHRSALVANFAWNSEVAYREAAPAVRP